MKLKRIFSVGVEFECGIPCSTLFDVRNDMLGDDRFNYGGDSSVRVHPPPKFRGNWESSAEVRFWSTSPEEILSFVKRLFDGGARQNESCGNHVHIKFSDKRILSLFADYKMIKEFHDRYAEKWQHDDKFMRRLGNSYCFPLSKSDMAMALINEGSRFYSINFKSLWGHGTLEIRILPHADNYEEYKEMFLWLLETLEELATMALKRKTVLVRLEMPNVNYFSREEGEV